MATRYAFLFLGASLTLSSFGQLVINEVDYDQPGNDGAEFIELKNTGSTAVDMSTIAVMMVNGSSGTGVVYASYFSEDWPMLAPGAYFTLCGDTTAGCDARLMPASNAVQNGATDAIALILRGDSSFVDRLGYEGFLAGYAEGNGFDGGDDNVNENRSIGRFPDGVDTDNNNGDFIVMCNSLGETNNGDTIGCTTIGVAELSVAENFSLIADEGNDRVLMAYGPANGKVTFEVFSVDGALMASHTVAASGKANWAWNTGGLHGRMLIVRVSGAMGTKAKRVVLP